MNRHLVIFAKAPRIGQVKSRLAADIGKVAAWSFYRRTLQQVIRPLARDPRWQCWLGLTPNANVILPDLPIPIGRRFTQSSGDLANRMGRVMLDFPPGPVLIIGTDVPDIRPHHIEQAFQKLKHHDYVFGPADDGGYWLVGQRRQFRPHFIFDNIRWSSKHTLADTCKNIPPSSSIAMLDTLVDIDDAQSIINWQPTQPGQ